MDGPFIQTLISSYSQLEYADDPYSLGPNWTVFTTVNQKRNIMQVSAFYRGEFAFHLLDIVPSRSVGSLGFAIKITSTGQRKVGSYRTQSRAATCGKQWLKQFPKYAISLKDKYLKENHDSL